MPQPISLSAPDVTEAEIAAVVDVMKTPRLSLGPKVPEFEDAFVRRLGCKHAVACNSGTSGLHLIWSGLGVGPGDEVITTPFSFIASSNSIMFTGGRPVFVDIDPQTWQIDARRIEGAITPRTKALMPVDVFGSIPDMDAILAIARKRGLRVVEDSCEALGASYKGRPAGLLADAGCFGMYPNKQITTGEGGMIVTNDDRVAFIARSLRNQGRDPDAGWLAHARLGFNYRMPDINCAIGVVQMRRLDQILAKRTQVAEWYRQRLTADPRLAGNGHADDTGRTGSTARAGDAGNAARATDTGCASSGGRLSLQRIPPEVHVSWFVFVVRLSDDYKQEDRDRIMKSLSQQGIGTNNYFTPIHLQPFYREAFGYKPGDFPVTEALSARTIALPFHNALTERDIDRVVAALRALL